MAGPRGRRSRRRRAALAAIVGALVVAAVALIRPVRESARAAVRHVTDVTRVEQHAALLREVGAEFGLDPNLLAGLMLSESGGRADAVSSVDALGLFQLKLETARDMARRMGEPEPSRADLLRDERLNARLAGRYLVWLDQQFDGHLDQMLVAYNAGPGRLRAWIEASGGWEAWVAERRAADSPRLAFVDKVLHYAGVFARRGVVVPPPEGDR